MKEISTLKTKHGNCSFVIAQSITDSPYFWQLMGEWFANKNVADTLGEGLYDNPFMVWCLSIINTKVVGFGAIDMSKADKKIALFNYGFISENYRGLGIYKKNLEARIKFIEQETSIEKIKALCTAESAPTLAKLGFFEKSKKGRYTWFEKEIFR